MSVRVRFPKLSGVVLTNSLNSFRACTCILAGVHSIFASVERCGIGQV